MARIPARRLEPEAAFTVSIDTLAVRTEERLQFVDITEEIRGRVRRSGVRNGSVNVQTRHTTTAIVVNENEPLLLRDLADLLRRWAPRDVEYRHNLFDRRKANLVPGERPNGHSHARALVLGTSETLNVRNGLVELGRWQRVFLVELDGPRSRAVSVAVAGTVADAGDGPVACRPAGRAAAGGAS